jgi:hypothetical protein
MFFFMDRGDDDGGPGCVGTVAGPYRLNDPMYDRECKVTLSCKCRGISALLCWRRSCVLLRNVSIVGDLGLRSVCWQRVGLLRLW